MTEEIRGNTFVADGFRYKETQGGGTRGGGGGRREEVTKSSRFTTILYVVEHEIKPETHAVEQQHPRSAFSA